MSPDINIPAIIETAKQAAAASNTAPELHHIDGVPCIVTKSANGTVSTYPLVVPEKYQANPKRKRAQVSLYEAASFINYVNRHKIDYCTHLFGKATELGGTFTAIIDYHDEENSKKKAASEATDTEKDSPELYDKIVNANWGEHVVQLKLETTPEWRRWVENDKKLMPQETFLEFLEENQNDIIAPDQASVLETIQLLQGTKSVAFKGGKNLKTGAIALQYVETIDIRGQASNQERVSEVPDKLRLGIVPFIGANGVEIDARLRFRIGPDGKLSFAYLLNRPYQIIEEAFGHARQDIEAAVGLPVMLGAAAITTA